MTFFCTRLNPKPRRSNYPCLLFRQLVTFLVAMTITMTVRVGLGALIKYIAKRRGKDPPDLPMLLYPAWEITVAVVTFQGLSESVGLALVSGCDLYIGLGSVTLVLLLLFLCFSIYVTRLGVGGGFVVYERTEISDQLKDIKGMWTRGEGPQGWISRPQAYYSAISALRERGGWGDSEKERVDSRFLPKDCFADRLVFSHVSLPHHFSL